MGKIDVDPYLFFRGNAEEALEFYKTIFGGEIEKVPYGEFMPAPKGLEGKLMHAYLGGGLVSLMASDTNEASEQSAKVSISISGTPEDEEKLTQVFTALSQGVTVHYPLKKEVWGDMFGSVTDKYGIDWMINIGQESK